MTENAHHHQHHGGHENHDHAGLAEILNLDAQVLGSYLEDTTRWAAQLVGGTPATIVDAGAGSGAGTVALAKRFATANILAMDKSAQMLVHTLEAARVRGVEGRVSTVQADLDEPWPQIASSDLIWASSSLHEVSDPEQTMRQMFAGLNPGGLLIVVEMDALPLFLPVELDDCGAPQPGLESRLHAAVALQEWNSYPEWSAGLERAGFELVDKRSFPSVSSAAPGLTARYAQTFFARFRQALEKVVSADDLAALDRLLAATGTESLAHRTDLQVRGSRTAWAARKP
ncbi:trans-aconitate 2-methyltransferase [Arthrobacter sp. GMC3]|uniref:class I SAM-dependent methyltransferase n=1 Tax=Arthrobacter sp. GMC3 TaxID=2058894 RepID=UPI000CE3DBA9|nr:methyltransferase [Arthrobacter sp. GMC3]